MGNIILWSVIVLAILVVFVRAGVEIWKVRKARSSLEGGGFRTMRHDGVRTFSLHSFGTSMDVETQTGRQSLHRIIADDVVTADKMTTPEQRAAAMKWFTETFPGNKGKVQTFPTQRIHKDAITGACDLTKAPDFGGSQFNQPKVGWELEQSIRQPRGKHPSIQTRYGSLFDLIEPHPGSVDIDDIALTCAREGRFGNRTKEHYSVAQHQVLAAILVWRRTHKHELALRAGTHDAHEAYIGDIMTPVLWALEWEAGQAVVSAMKTLKARLDKAILQRFNLEPLVAIHPGNEFISDADRQLLMWERTRFMEVPGGLWDIDEEAIYKLTAKDFGLAEDSPLLMALPAHNAHGLYWNMLRRLTRGWGLTGGLAEDADLSALPELNPILAMEMDLAFKIEVAS